MATSTGNNQLVVVSTLNTAPDQYSIKTGTLSTDGKSIIGVGTKFTTEFKEKDWLFDSSGLEVRQIDRIWDDTIMYLYEPFSTDIAAGTTVKRVPASRWQQWGYKANGAGAKVDGVTLAAGDFGTFGGDIDGSRTCDPVVIDGGISSIEIIRGAGGSGQ